MQSFTPIIQSILKTNKIRYFNCPNSVDWIINPITSNKMNMNNFQIKLLDK